MEKKPTELNGLMEELVDFFHPQAQLQKVQLRLKKSDGELVANIDPRLIKQTVLNLMLNGMQAMAQRRRNDPLARASQNGETPSST